MIEIATTNDFTRLFFWSLFWFIVALTWSIVEIELEGKYGWGEKAQTWYRSVRHHPKNFFIKYIMGGKPLSGYHLPTFFLALLVAHIPLLITWRWSITEELLILALWMAWAPLWDNLWIIFNPNYGVGKSGAENLWWYKKTIWFFNLFPFENVIQWTLSLILVFLVSISLGNFLLLTNQLIFLGFLISFSVISIFTLRPLYAWYYWKMREHDDRDTAGIFHK